MAAHASASSFDTTPPASTLTERRPFTPSPQQDAIFRWVETGTGNAFVEAVAGSGKSTTLVHACSRMSGSVAIAAYNKKAADDLKSKLAAASVDMGHVRAGTFHSFGFSAWRRAHSTVEVDDYRKRNELVDACEVDKRLESVVLKLVSLAKQSAFDSTWTPDDLQYIIDHHDLLFDLDTVDEDADARAVIAKTLDGLAWSRQVAGELIDFDDMIWLPVTTPRLRVWTNDWVLVDEAQDTNPARRLLARRMVNSGRFGAPGRAIFVGDRHQAIYGFTGADADAVELLSIDFKCVPLPLTVTYRCPKSVVELARKFVPHITAHESAVEGVVRSMSRQDFIKTEVDLLQPDDAILCRKTRPLVSLAFRLIKRGVGCHVEGRDIGSGLVKLATKWKTTTVAGLRRNLDAYRERETKKLTARLGKEGGIEYAIDALNDRVETLLIIADGCTTVDEVVAKITSMFRDTVDGQSSTLTLSTIHRAKGREWGKVYILGWTGYMPSPFARKAWQKQQEANLAYVAVTRAQRELVLLPTLED